MGMKRGQQVRVTEPGGNPITKGREYTVVKDEEDGFVRIGPCDDGLDHYVYTHRVRLVRGSTKARGAKYHLPATLVVYRQGAGKAATFVACESLADARSGVVGIYALSSVGRLKRAAPVLEELS